VSHYYITDFQIVKYLGFS